MALITLPHKIDSEVRSIAINYLNITKLTGGHYAPMRVNIVAMMLDKDGEVKFIGRNKRKSHPLQARFGKNQWSIFQHAEISCLINARFKPSNLFKYPMYVARVLSNGKFGMCRPCSGCQKGLLQFSVTDVYYTNEFGEFERL